MQSRAVVAALPHSIQITVPYVNTVRTYLTVVVGLFGMAVAVAGIGYFSKHAPITVVYQRLSCMCLTNRTSIVMSTGKPGALVRSSLVLAAGSQFNKWRSRN